MPSFSRSYKNGFVWHDLSDDDLVLPAQGNEYVLKGSELLDQSPSGNATAKILSETNLCFINVRRVIKMHKLIASLSLFSAFRSHSSKQRAKIAEH